MKKIEIHLIFPLLLASLTAGSQSAVSPGDQVSSSTTGIHNRDWTILATYTVPGKASGLAFDGEYLFCGIYGVNSDKVYRINPDDGSYVEQFSNPDIDDAFGLTCDGTNLWTIIQPVSSSNQAQATEMDISGGNFLSQIILPDHYMSGIAFDNGNFWVATYYPDPGKIYKVDPSGNVLVQFQSPNQQPWDICVENGSLWVADYNADMIYKLDQSGNVLENHPSQGIKPSGIVYDGQYLWYVDGQLGSPSTLYKVDLSGSGTPQINIPVAEYNYGPVTIGDSVVWYLEINNSGTGDLVVDHIAIPDAVPIFSWYAFPAVLSPGDQILVDLIYKPQDPIPLNALITVYSNDPVHLAVDVTLTGVGVISGPSLFLTESWHDYQNVRMNAFTRWFAEIRNLGDEPLIITDLIFDDSHFFADEGFSLPCQIPVQGSALLGIWFHPEENMNYTATIDIINNDPFYNPAELTLEGTGLNQDYPVGTLLWDYSITTSYDNSPKAIAPLNDITGDGINEVIICSEDDFIRCLNGNSSGTADVLWEREIYAGAVYSQNALSATTDLDNDGYNDLVAGTAWGDRSIICLSGKDGSIIWKHDTHEYGDGGWVYQVNYSYDYNNDGTSDILAATSDDANNTGPRRIYCLDAFTGIPIWDCVTEGPVFSVIGIEDFNGDMKPDVLAGASDSGENEGRVYGINGLNGNILWTAYAEGTSVWALTQTDDANGDGIKDVMAGDFGGHLYLLDAADGSVIHNSSIGPCLILRFEKLNDVNGDAHPDVLIGHSGSNAVVVDGMTCQNIWLKPVADMPCNIDRIEDISGDGINDVIIGTLYADNYCYFLDGTDGSEIESVNTGDPVDAISAISDITGDGSMEVVTGGRSGSVTCLSGGLNASIGIKEPSLVATPDIRLSVHPNPLHEETVVFIKVNQDIIFDLVVIDVQGRVVRSLIGDAVASDLYSVIWDGTDDAGNSLPEGIYFITIVRLKSDFQLTLM
ncbi:MAG: PQQ-binding-like beta-propeller repeat protein [Bacteroidetes bacterium]|nr:PQQ-binding-like beta-propeller repeat protein [Bacteroidota bacterium]